MSSIQTRPVTVIPASQQPQVIIIKDQKESLVSKGIGDILARHVVTIGGLGFFAGGLSGVLSQNSYPLITAIIGGATMATVATVGVKSLQLAADFGVNTTIYVVKLPFRAGAALITGTVNGVQSLYASIKGEAQDPSSNEEVSSPEELALDKNIA